MLLSTCERVCDFKLGLCRCTVLTTFNHSRRVSSVEPFAVDPECQSANYVMLNVVIGLADIYAPLVRCSCVFMHLQGLTYGCLPSNALKSTSYCLVGVDRHQL